MFHLKLQNKIKEFLGESFVPSAQMKAFLQSVSDSYHQEEVNGSSKAEMPNLENSADDSGKHLPAPDKHREEELLKILEEKRQEASIPLENPAPVYRTTLAGEIIFQNKAAAKLNCFKVGDKQYSPSEFFRFYSEKISNQIGKFEVIANDCEYLFNYKLIEEVGKINFYGVDITDYNTLKKKAEDNFYRLNNFLESTEETYYIIYDQHTERNFFTSRWEKIFGFSPLKSDNILLKRRKNIHKDYLSAYDNALDLLSTSGKSNLLYASKNPKTKEVFWLDESVSRYYDEQLGETITRGRIKNITNEYVFSIKIKESEERFKMMMEAVPVMVWVSDKNNKVTYQNAACRAFFCEYPENNPPQELNHQLFHPPDVNGAYLLRNKKIRERQIIELECSLQDCKGIYHDFLEKATPRFWENKEFAGYIGTYFDITKDKKYQQELLNEKEKLDRISTHSPDLIFLINAKGIIEYVSPSVSYILGYDPSFLENKRIEDFVVEECRSKPGEIYSPKRGKHKSSTIEYRMQKKNGETIWVESATTVMNASTKEEIKILMHNRDISLIKQAELVLKESEQKYRGLFENMQLGVMEVDLNEDIVWMNEAFEKMSGYSLRNAKGKNAIDLFMIDDVEKEKMYEVSKVRQEKKLSTYETSLKRKDGKMLDLVISGAPIIDLSGKNRGSVGIHWDVSDIRAMERTIAEEALTRQHEIMEASLNAEEKQKELLGHELHDSVGQILTYTSLYLQMAADDATEKNNEVFKKAQQKIIEALNEVRRISRSLTPPALVDLGLKEALVEFLNQYSELKKPVFTFIASERIFAGLAYEAQIMIYRVIQELSNNTIKHAKASTVNVLFSRTKSALVLHYSDDGIGFEEKNLKKGVGLKSIKSRVSYYKGTLSIHSSNQNGTTFIIKLPLQKIIPHAKKNHNHHS
jgi:PAS domain S-box-containing protein